MGCGWAFFLFNLPHAVMRQFLFRLSLIFSLLFLAPSYFLSGQDLPGARIVYSGLPDDESIFTCFLFHGTTYVASAPDDDPRSITLWRLEDADLAHVRDISIPTLATFSAGFVDVGPIHLNPKIQLPFFARTANWIYFLDATGSAVAQLHRTDGVTTERLTNFEGIENEGGRHFFDSLYVRHISSIVSPAQLEAGPFFIYERLDAEPDRLYYLVQTYIDAADEDFRVELWSIKDASGTPTRVVANVYDVTPNDSYNINAFFTLQNLGGKKLLVGNDTTGSGNNAPFLISTNGARASITFERPDIQTALLEPRRFRWPLTKGAVYFWPILCPCWSGHAHLLRPPEPAQGGHGCGRHRERSVFGPPGRGNGGHRPPYTLLHAPKWRQ